MADEWAIVQVLESVEDAELVAGYLQSRGIDCQVDSSHSTEFPATVGNLGVVRLEVPVGQLDEARRVLAERDGAGAGIPEGTLMDEATGEAVRTEGEPR